MVQQPEWIALDDSDSSGGAPPLWLIFLTLGIYCGFLIAFGNTIFGNNVGTCNDLTSCVGNIFGILGGFFNLLTLGGFSGALPPLVQGVLLLVMALSWGIIITKLIIAGVGAVVP